MASQVARFGPGQDLSALLLFISCFCFHFGASFPLFRTLAAEMEDSSRSGASVVPPGSDMQAPGSQNPSESVFLSGVSEAIEDKLDSTEAGFREDMSRMLSLEVATGSAPAAKPAVRHSRDSAWILGVPGMRVLFQRSKLEEMPVSVRDGALFLPPDAGVYGADVGLEAIGLKPFTEKDLDDDKLRKALPAVSALRGRGAALTGKRGLRTLRVRSLARGCG